jgi:hypothetical protein
MSTATLSIQRPATFKTGTPLKLRAATLWSALFGTGEDPVEQYLAQAESHADLAIRRRACAAHEARVQALSLVL